MSTSSAEARRTRAAAEAADWVRRLDDDDLSSSERGEFVDWLRESPVHVAEMLRMGRLTSALEKFGAWGAIPPGGAPASANVTSLIGPGLTKPSPAPRRARQWQAGIAAGLLLAACALFLLHLPSGTTVHTQAGERREITLADGSVVRLSPQTDLRIRLEPHLRSLVIVRGEVMFHVAKDGIRPFVVDAAGTRVQALGTVFSVASNAETVVVTVTEGRVKVTPDSSKPDRDIELGAYQRVSVSARGTLRPVRQIEAAPAQEWGENQMVFENARVADVVSRFNRRNRVQILIGDDALGSRTVSGVFAADDPRSFVDFLQAVAGAVSTDGGNDEIVVAPAPTGSPPVLPAR